MYCDLKNINFLDADLYRGKLLFYNFETKIFYLYDLRDETISFMEIIDADEFYMNDPRRIIRNGDFLYFIQSDPCTMYKFEHIGSKLIFKDKIIVKNFEGNVKNAFQFKGSIYIIPCSLDFPLAIIELETDKIEYCSLHTNNDKEIREIIFDKGMLYIIYGDIEDLSIVNLYDRTINTYNTGIKNGIEGMAIRAGNVILREKYGKRIFCWNKERNEYQLLAMSELKFEEQSKLRLLSDGTIIICPIDKKTFFYVNESERIIQSVQSNEELNRINDATFTIETLEYEDALYVYPWAGESLVKIYRDGQNVKAKNMRFRINNKEYADYYYNHKAKGQIKEHDNFSLKELLERI